MAGLLDRNNPRQRPQGGLLGMIDSQPYLYGNGLTSTTLERGLLDSATIGDGLVFDVNDFRWMETLKGGDSPTGEPIIHINKNKFKEELGRDLTDEDMETYYLSETLHNLKDVSPALYNDLYSSALNSPEYMEWAKNSYKRSKDDYGEKRSFDDWHRTSRFDQVIGGFLFAGHPSFPTMKNWDRNEPYGQELKGRLESLRKDLKLN